VGFKRYLSGVFIRSLKKGKRIWGEQTTRLSLSDESQTMRRKRNEGKVESDRGT